jgi:hypothetical protein
MNPYNCNWNTPTKWKPDLRMYQPNPNLLLKQSGVEWIYKCSNENKYYGVIPNSNKKSNEYIIIGNNKQDLSKNNLIDSGGRGGRGGGGIKYKGFFGEVKGSCGFKTKNDCCFSKCKPLWKTKLYPFNNIYL